MQDPATLSKSQLLELLEQQRAALATQSREVAKRDDVIGQLEEKIKQLEKDYLKLWQERFAAKSERYIEDPDQLPEEMWDVVERLDAIPQHDAQHLDAMLLHRGSLARVF
jgi:SMC interacting uncharacterized protein involved in chromosome segregation